MALNAVVWILRSGFITCPRTGFFCCFVSCRPEFFEKSTTFWITERWFSLGEPTLSHVVGPRGRRGQQRPRHTARWLEAGRAGPRSPGVHSAPRALRGAATPSACREKWSGRGVWESAVYMLFCLLPSECHIPSHCHETQLTKISFTVFSVVYTENISLHSQFQHVFRIIMLYCRLT